MPIRSFFRLLFALSAGWILATRSALAEPLTRAEALKIAESYVQHAWFASAKNLRHGQDRAGIEVHTPDRDGGHGDPAADCWRADSENIGVAYKWGGFDLPVSYDLGVRAGKAAGDIYTADKRKKGGAAVSAEAVGIDCSGFVSRCWRLSEKHSTSMLFSISQRLASTAELRPADVMNTSEGHVLLFVRWLDPEKKRARFYEAAPFSKTRATERDLAELVSAGYQPLRYRRLLD